MMKSLACLTLIVGSLAACTHAPPARLTVVEAGGEVAPAAPVTIAVTSAFEGPLAVYAMNEGVATKLGDVTRGHDARFQLDATQLPSGGLTLIAVPTAGDARAMSQRLRLVPGNVVEFTIGRALTDARALVRSP